MADKSKKPAPKQGQTQTTSSQGATDYGSNMAQQPKVVGPAAKNAGRLNAAQKNLGDVSSLGSDFSSAAGGFLDALVPNEGDSGKLQIIVNVPVDAAKVVKVGLEFTTEISREDKGLKAKVKLGGGVIASKKVDAYFFTAKAVAQAQVYGFMEAQGDSGKEVFDLFALAIQQRVKAVSADLANAMFSAKYIDSVVKGMGQDDYVKSGMGAEVSFSGELGVSNKATGKGVSTNRGAKGEAVAATRLEKGPNGQLVQKDASKVGAELSAGIKGKVPPFDVSGKLTAKMNKTGPTELKAEVTGETMISGKELSDLVTGSRMLSGMVSQFGALIGGSSGMMKNASASRKIGAFASLVKNGTGVGNLASAASAKAISKMGQLGVEMGHKLTLKSTYDVAKNATETSLKLERVSQIKFGHANQDTVAVLAKNVQRVFEVKF